MTVNNSFKGEPQTAITVILLSIVTCGIYGLVWWYQRGVEVNKVLGRDAVSPVFIFIPILNILYLYNLDMALVEIGKLRGVDYQSSFVKWILLCILCGIGGFIAIFQICDFLNQVWAKTD